MEPMTTPNSIRTRADLAQYLDTLASAVRQGDVPTENVTAADLIDGASAWIADMDGYFANRGEVTPQEPTWALIAAIFQAALIYE
jgi:hypothetical protein